MRMRKIRQIHAEPGYNMIKHFGLRLIDPFLENLDKFCAPKKNQEKHKSIKILGAYGTKAKGFGSTSFALNKKNVIDAGNLLNSLDEECAFIENIWVSHPHLDHISDMAYILDNYFLLRTKPLNIMGTQKTLDAIKKHFLNGIIWPDFSKIKLYKSSKMAVYYTVVELGKEYSIGDNESVKAFKTVHTEGSCGYIYKKNGSGVLITTDTGSLDSMIDEVDQDQEIKSIIVECSFPNNMEQLARDSKHLTPKLLFNMLEALKRDDVNIYINHMKPTFILQIVKEIDQYKGKWEPILLKDGDVINF